MCLSAALLAIAYGSLRIVLRSPPAFLADDIHPVLGLAHWLIAGVCLVASLRAVSGNGLNWSPLHAIKSFFAAAMDCFHAACLGVGKWCMDRPLFKIRTTLLCLALFGISIWSLQSALSSPFASEAALLWILGGVSMSGGLGVLFGLRWSVFGAIAAVIVLSLFSW
jgi:hypothetical protein